jgi:hypothetical protein
MRLEAMLQEASLQLTNSNPRPGPGRHQPGGATESLAAVSLLGGLLPPELAPGFQQAMAVLAALAQQAVPSYAQTVIGCQGGAAAATTPVVAAAVETVDLSFDMSPPPATPIPAPPQALAIPVSGTGFFSQEARSARVRARTHGDARSASPTVGATSSTMEEDFIPLPQSRSRSSGRVRLRQKTSVSQVEVPPAGVEAPARYFSRANAAMLVRE